MDNKKKKTSWRHVIKNNLYILKIVHRAAPEIIWVQIVNVIVNSIMYFGSGPYLLRYIINGYQTGEDFSKIFLFIAVIYSIRFLMTILSGVYYQMRFPVVELKLTSYVQKMMFEKASAVELACYENTEFFDNYVKASNDAVNRINQVLYSVRNVVSTAMWLSMFSVLIFSIDPFLIFFSLIVVVVSLVFEKKKNIISHEYDMKRQEEERQRDYTRRTFYLSDFAKEMRLTDIHYVMLKRFDKSVKNIISYVKKYGFKLAVIDYIEEESREVLSGMGGMLYAVYRTLVSQTMLYGDCLVVIDSIQSTAYGISNSINMVMTFHQNSLYIDNLRTFLEYEPAIKGGDITTPDSGDLILHNVSFRYSGQTGDDVLKNISIKVGANEKIALVGHNGAGKSTLVKLMLRLYDPTDGEITYGNHDIREYTLTGENSYRERFGAVFQDFKMFSLSVADNILLRRNREGDETLVDEALNNSGVHDKIMTLPNREHTILTREFDENGAVLSGGEEQKISIARTFARDSRIVLLDEPSSALDPIAEYKMYESMMRVCENKAVVFISHRLSSAVLADRIYLLENGEAIETGSHRELMAAGGKYAEMFTLQAKNYVSEETYISGDTAV